MLSSNLDYSSAFTTLVSCMFHPEMCEANLTEKGSNEAFQCIPLSPSALYAGHVY